MGHDEYLRDHIRIEQLDLSAHIGVSDAERAAAQRLTVGLTLWPARQMQDLGDDIQLAVDYATVCTEAKKFAEGRRDKLIETLADTLANHLLEAFEIHRISVEVRKYILPEVEFVSVTVTRERARE